MSSTVTKTQSILVTCINKPDRNSTHEGITHIGGVGWRWTRQQVINELESANPRYAFYTSANGKTAWIGVREGQYGKYIQTYADKEWNNNLLALPECVY